jgi:hypothetical protein
MVYLELHGEDTITHEIVQWLELERISRAVII